METMIVEREQALWPVAKLLAEYEPNVKEVLKVVNARGKTYRLERRDRLLPLGAAVRGLAGR